MTAATRAPEDSLIAPYLGRGLWDLILWLPLILQASLVGSAVFAIVLGSLAGVFVLAVAVYFSHRFGQRLILRYAGNSRPAPVAPGRWLSRYQPPLVLGAYTAVVAIIGLLLPDAHREIPLETFAAVMMWAHPGYLPLSYGVLAFGATDPVLWLIAPLGLCGAYGRGMVVGCEKLGWPAATRRGSGWVVALAIVLASVVWWRYAEISDRKASSRHATPAQSP